MTGYNSPINYNFNVNYNGDGSGGGLDTHDGLKKKKHHGINLPIYITTKKKITAKQVIKELPKQVAKELKQVITPELAQYDIDWMAVSGYVKESGRSIDAIMQQLEILRIQFENEREQEEQDFMLLVLALSKM